MVFVKKKYFVVLALFIFFLFCFLYLHNIQKKKDDLNGKIPIAVNLLTSVHPNLSWNFKPIKPKFFIKPGEVTTVEYMVENLENKETTGIATFSYFPKEFGAYIKKLNCFCYDAQPLKAKQKSKYSVVLLIDPEVTKDSKTKNIKEVTIQFTFFDHKDYKEKKS